MYKFLFERLEAGRKSNGYGDPKRLIRPREKKSYALRKGEGKFLQMKTVVFTSLLELKRGNYVNYPVNESTLNGQNCTDAVSRLEDGVNGS